MTTGSSGAPQLDYLVTWLCLRQSGVQFVGVHVPGVLNVVADKLSRGAAESVLTEVRAAGMVSERLHPDADAQTAVGIGASRRVVTPARVL